jgi:hypothetical protein
LTARSIDGSISLGVAVGLKTRYNNGYHIYKIIQNYCRGPGVSDTYLIPTSGGLLAAIESALWPVLV